MTLDGPAHLPELLDIQWPIIVAASLLLFDRPLLRVERFGVTACLRSRKTRKRAEENLLKIEAWRLRRNHV
jgi:hypothetical protein